MGIKITHARSNENGGITGGRLGDNNGMEICTTDFYVHVKGWIVIRPKDAQKAKIIADTALEIDKNNAFGYDQDRRDTGIAEAKKKEFNIPAVTVLCALDCSSMVRLCCLKAGINVGDFYTGNEKQVLLQTGAFNTFAYTSTTVLKRGDILVTKTKGHTAIVTSTEAVKDKVWEQVGKDWYYYADGKMVKSEWVKYKNYWYRLGTDGKMLTGYHKIYDKNGKLRECFFGEEGKLYHEASDKQGYLEPWLDA